MAKCDICGKDGITKHEFADATCTAPKTCKECGATLRFLLPVVAALGITATFHLEGNLPSRPLSPLWELLH